MSQQKLHYNSEKGIIGKCSAVKGRCPFNDSEDPNGGHYSTQEEIDNYLERKFSKIEEKEYLRKDPKKTALSEFIPEKIWEEALSNGDINSQKDSTGNLSIYKYSKLTQYNKKWNEATLAARGLILDKDGYVIARPYRKFFNYGELTDEEKGELKGPIVVSDKLDGSLGISYIDPSNGEFKIASSGSFTSEMAEHANKIYEEKYKGKWEPEEGYTYLYEVIYPENRIVVDYKGEDDIILTGKVNIATGKSVPLDTINEWPGKKAEVFPYKTLGEALQAPPRDNREGVVIHFTDSDKRVKIKYEEYVKLHRTATGLTSIRIWESLSGHPSPKVKSYEELRASIEEEFLPYFDEKVALYRSQVQEYIDRSEKTYVEIRKRIGPQNLTKKALAAEIFKKDSGLTPSEAGYIMNLHEGKSQDKTVKDFWRMVRPKHEKISKS